MGYYVRVEQDVHIYIEDVNPGSDKTILFLHGWPLNHKLFEYQFNQLPKMGFRCIGIDIRGFGNSDKPWGGYHYDRLSDDIRSVVDALQLENFTLAGHSMGGAISIRYMARHNGFGVSKLALIAAAAPTAFTKETAKKLLTEMYNDRPKMLHGVKDDFFFQFITDPFSDRFIQLGLEAASWSTAATIISLRDENMISDLNRIVVPTLILHGIHDKVIPFSYANILDERIQNSKLVPFENSGHSLFWEERDKLNRELAQFIE